MLLTSILLDIDNCNSADELANMTTVLDALMWVEAAARETKELCMKKCFEKTGFKFKQSWMKMLKNSRLIMSNHLMTP